MKGFYGVIIIFALVFMCLFPVAYLSYAREADAEFSLLLLSKAADYAGEAAMAACVEVAHLDSEYSDETYMVMSPERAGDAFAEIMCLSYGLPGTERNIASVKQMIPVMLLAANDGYHIADRQITGNGESALVWTPKRPYIVDTSHENPNVGTAYGVELGMTHWYAVDKSTLTLTDGDDYSLLPFTRETMLQHINLAINRDITAILARYVIDGEGTDTHAFHLPLSQSTVGVRRIEKPGLIVVMRNVSLDGGRALNLSVVSGMMVTQKRMIVAWTDGSGGKYYCYSGQLDSTAQHWATINGVIFESIEQAARAGYAPDPGVFR